MNKLATIANKIIKNQLDKLLYEKKDIVSRIESQNNLMTILQHNFSNIEEVLTENPEDILSYESNSEYIQYLIHTREEITNNILELEKELDGINNNILKNFVEKKQLELFQLKKES